MTASMHGPITFLIPRIETEHLTLSAPRESDFDGYASIVMSERGRFIAGPLDREAAWLDFSQMVAGWIFRGFGALTVRFKAADEYLGTVLVHHEYGDPEPELGWLFTEAVEGHGYAFEAGSAMRDWAFASTALRTLVSYIDPANERAISLAVRLGGRPVAGPKGVVTYRYTRGNS